MYCALSVGISFNPIAGGLVFSSLGDLECDAMRLRMLKRLRYVQVESVMESPWFDLANPILGLQIRLCFVKQHT